MVHGETELQCGDGRSVKVKAPEMIRSSLSLPQKPTAQTLITSPLPRRRTGQCDPPARSPHHARRAPGHQSPRMHHHLDLLPPNGPHASGRDHQHEHPQQVAPDRAVLPVDDIPAGGHGRAGAERG